MQARQPTYALAIDLTRFHRRAVTSFYSDLVTRPTGRAVRLGVERQLAELTADQGPCLSILDFSQVRVMDYSCADEIVAKLLLGYGDREAPSDVFFLARGLQDHHLESIEAVLERHGLLLAEEVANGRSGLLGPASSEERSCWDALVRHGKISRPELAPKSGLAEETILPALQRFLTSRVVAALPDDMVCPVTKLSGG